MEVNVSSLSAEINKYNKLVSEYENNLLNLYNILGQTSSYWQDTNSGRFMSSVWAEKTQANKLKSDMENVKSLLSSIKDKYSSIGNKIVFSLSSRDSVKSNFTNYINNINNVINAYNSLDYAFSEEAGAISEQKSSLNGCRNQAEQMKNSVDKIFKKIKDNETEIASKIAGTSIAVISKNDVSSFIGKK